MHRDAVLLWDVWFLSKIFQRGGSGVDGRSPCRHSGRSIVECGAAVRASLRDRKASLLSHPQSLGAIPRRQSGMTGRVLPADDVREVLARAKQAAVDYYRLTGKPLGITGEVGEYEAARLLGLTLLAARVPDHDATDASGLRHQIKSRAVPDPRRANVGSIQPDQEWDAVLLVLMNPALETQEIWKAERNAVVAALAAPGSKARNKRGALSVSKFRQIGTRIWPEFDEPAAGCGLSRKPD